MTGCWASDCVRRGEHAVHESATGALWQEPRLGSASGDALVHAHVYTYDELRLARAGGKIGPELEGHGLIERVMQNRAGVYRLTEAGRAVATLRIRRRMGEAAARLAAGEAPPLASGGADAEQMRLM